MSSRIETPIVDHGKMIGTMRTEVDDPYQQDLMREACLLIKKYNREELQEILLIVARSIV